MSHGKMIRKTIEYLIDYIRLNGRPITVDNKGTIESLNHSFTFEYGEKINTDDIMQHMIEFYQDLKIDYEALALSEHDEYLKITHELLNKSEQFENDIYSRRVLWTNDCCISLIQFLIRDGVLHCLVTFRSSDVINKLFMDLYLIHSVIGIVHEKYDHIVKGVYVQVTCNSLHEVVIKDTEAMRLTMQEVE